MANPQPTDPHGVIAHDIQENILLRNFTKVQLKLIYLIIRLSWGCRGCKAWQYESYADFLVIGLHKGDVSKQLKYLADNKVIMWWPKYRLVMFNKNYDDWTIPVTSKIQKIQKLVNESLRKANEVSDLLTTLVKKSNNVSDLPTSLVKNPNGSSQETQANQAISETEIKVLNKDSIVVAAIENGGVPSAGVPSPVGEVPSSPPPKNAYTELEHHYCRAVGRVVPSAKDLKSMSKALDMYPLSFITKVIDTVTQKAVNDRINSFNYFMPILKEEWKKEKIRRERGGSDGRPEVNNQWDDDQYAGIGISL